MARHRKVLAPRHKARGRDASPASSEASGRFGAAVRRVVVTPTFAAGLGVVVAAILAYPMQTVFSYVAPGASGQGSGLVCTRDGCTHHSGRGRPYPFGVGDGTLSPPSPGSAEPGNDSARQRAGGSGAVAQPRLTYQITGRRQGRFWARMTITFPEAVPPGWRLRIGYPARHILRIRPSSYLAPGGHAALVRSTDYSGGWGPGGRTFAVTVTVQGRPTRPGRCRFNGRHCHFG